MITIPNKLYVARYGTNIFVELTPYIAYGGLKWSDNDVDASDAGRTQDGLMHRARVAVKARLDVNCTPLSADNMKVVLQAIQYEWLYVKFYDPKEGAMRTATMYRGNVSSQFLKMNADGTSLWQNLTFPLIEQ